MMNIITPEYYTTSIMHQIPDIENNKYEIINNKLKDYDERLKKIEDKFNDKFNCASCIFDFIRLLEGVCLWTLVILLCKKVF